MERSRTFELRDSLGISGVSASALQAVLRGERQALARFVTQVAPRVRAVACRICGQTDGEDAAQAALIAIVRGVNDLREADALGAWVDRVVIQVSLSWLRRERRRGALMRRWRMPDKLPWGQDGESAPCETLGMTGLLRSLPSELRELLLMRYVLDLSVTEIGQMTSTPEGTVRHRLRRSHKLLVRQMKRASRMLCECAPLERPGNAA